MVEKQEKRELEDPIVAEVRAARDAHAKKFNYDLDAIFEDFVKSRVEHEKMGFKYVTLPAKRIPKRTGTNNF